MNSEKKLDDFFAQYSSPVEIVLILDGALRHLEKLAPHGQGNNLLFYRPKTSHRKQVDEAYLLGEIHPDRAVLFFDEDMLEGSAIREAAKHFEELGYSRTKMFGYLVCGFRESSDGPQLMHIDDLLEEGQKVRLITLEMGYI